MRIETGPAWLACARLVTFSEGQTVPGVRARLIGLVGGQEQLDVLDLELAEIGSDVLNRGLDHRIADDLDLERAVLGVMRVEQWKGQLPGWVSATALSMSSALSVSAVKLA